MKRQAVAYIDGLNLYHGALKGTDLKWVDLPRLVALHARHARVTKIKYFTGRLVGDPDTVSRQNIYLTAFAASGVEMFFGKFKERVFNAQVVDRNITQGIDVIQVRNQVEKQTDVCLATELVADGFENLYELAIVFTNDSDLVPAIKKVREKLNKQILVINPHYTSATPAEIKQIAGKTMYLDPKILAKCQLSDPYPIGASRQLHKPPQRTPKKRLPVQGV
jgi:uncharacterized LabA/DUF88 family protein